MATTSKAKASVAATRKTPAGRTARKAPAKAVAVKTPARPAVKKAPVRTVRKPVLAAKAVPVVAKPVQPVKAVVAPKKVKLVRDSFSFPAHEHALLGEMKKRALKLGKEFKKSEILRAGIAHMASLADGALVTLLSKVERVKTGRPLKKSKKK